MIVPNTPSRSTFFVAHHRHYCTRRPTSLLPVRLRGSGAVVELSGTLHYRDYR